MIKKEWRFLFFFRWGCIRLARHSFQLRSISQSGINGRAWNRISREDASSLDQRKRRNRRLAVTMRKTMRGNMLKFVFLICWNSRCESISASRDRSFLAGRSSGDRFLRFEDAINVVVRRIHSRPSAYYLRVSAARSSSRRHSSGRAAGYYPACNPLYSFFFIESNEPPRHVVINTLES